MNSNETCLLIRIGESIEYLLSLSEGISAMDYRRDLIKALSQFPEVEDLQSQGEPTYPVTESLESQVSDINTRLNGLEDLERRISGLEIGTSEDD